jgi:4-amino-4-deoxy-L-arabinose transferase-like glycosyltransferase
VERPHGRTLIAAATGVWIVAAVIRWAIGSPLGHDEARYALSARYLVHGHLPRWDYVPPGVAALGVPGILLGGGERVLRLVPLVANLGLLAAAFAVARRFSRETAAWTLAVLAGTLPLVRLSSDLLSDIPSAALVLGAGPGLLSIWILRAGPLLLAAAWLSGLAVVAGLALAARPGVFDGIRARPSAAARSPGRSPAAAARSR